MFDLLIFDLDGTLVDSALEIVDATNEVLRSRNLPPVPNAQVRGWIGNGARETVIHALAHTGGRTVQALRADRVGIDAAMERFSQAYTERCGARSRPYPRVLETLRRLQREHVPMALVTNKESRLTKRVLDIHGLHPFFDPVVSGDTLARRKPDPLPLLRCMEMHGTTAPRALMVGDSPPDIAAAHAADMVCWAVSYGYSMGRPIAESNPDRILARFSDILAEPDTPAGRLAFQKL